MMMLRSFPGKLHIQINNRWLIYLLTLLPPLAVFGLYGYIGAFNRLLGDSLCSFYFAERLGLLRSIWYWRLTWSGRYSAYAFDWLTMKVFGAKYIPLFIPLTLVVWIFTHILATHLLMRSNPHGSNKIYLPLILGPLSVFLILTSIPEVQQSFLWVDGFRAYTLPVILLGIFLILYYIFIGKINSRPSLLVASIVAFFLFFGNGGLSETFATFQFSLLAFAIAYYWFIARPGKMDRNLWLLVAGLLGALVSLLVVMTAPGNAVRQSLFPTPPGLFDLIRISLIGYADFLGKIFFTPEKVTALLGTVAISVWAGSIYHEQIRQHKNKILFLLFGAVLLSFSCFPPGVYGYSEPPPERVMIIAVFIMAVLLMSASFLAGNLWQQKNATHAGHQTLLLLTALLLIAFSAWRNVDALYNSRSTYISFAQRWDAVDALITEAKNEGKQSVDIPHMYNWAQIDEPNDNPKHWANECYSAFYGIQVFGPAQ